MRKTNTTFKTLQNRRYKITNKNARSKMKEAKERWIVEKCGEIETDMMQGNNKKADKTPKLLTKEKQNKKTAIKDKDGDLLTESSVSIK